MLIKGLPPGLGPPKKNGSVRKTSSKYSSTTENSSSTNRHTSPQNNDQTRNEQKNVNETSLDAISLSRRISMRADEEDTQREAYRYRVNPKAARALNAYQQMDRSEQKDQFSRLLGIDLYV